MGQLSHLGEVGVVTGLIDMGKERKDVALGLTDLVVQGEGKEDVAQGLDDWGMVGSWEEEWFGEKPSPIGMW